MNRLQRVVKLLGEDERGGVAAAHDAVLEIDAQQRTAHELHQAFMDELSYERSTLMSLIASYERILREANIPQPSGLPPPVTGTPPTTETRIEAPSVVSDNNGTAAGGGLSQKEKAKLKALIDVELRVKPNLTAVDAVALAEANGIPVHKRLVQPEAAVGTMVHFARKRAGIKIFPSLRQTLVSAMRESGNRNWTAEGLADELLRRGAADPQLPKDALTKEIAEALENLRGQGVAALEKHGAWEMWRLSNKMLPRAADLS